MAHVKLDRVQETTTGTGTGALTMAGAVSKFRAYSAVLANGDTCFCLIENASAAEWEVSLCTYASGGNTLTRSSAYASSNGGSLVNFSAGTKTVSLVAPASKSVVEDNNNDASVTRFLAVGHTAPAFRADIKSNTDIQIAFRNTAGTLVGYVGTDGAFGGVPTDALRFRSDAGAMVWGFSGAEYMRLNTSGLGVGITAAAKIHASGVDGALHLGISGTTKGIRFVSNGTGCRMEGVDNTLAAQGLDPWAYRRALCREPRLSKNPRVNQASTPCGAWRFQQQRQRLPDRASAP